MIKATRVPIICICNDRQHPKIRSLANHCFDLRFYKPKVEQIRGAMMSVCFKEGVQIKQQALSEIIMASGQDVRQVWCVTVSVCLSVTLSVCLSALDSFVPRTAMFKLPWR